MRFATLLAISVITVGCGYGPTEESATTTSAKSTVVEVTPAAFNVDGAPTVEIGVDMHCGGCAAGVCDTLRDLPGVVDVKADPDTDIATVAVDEAEFDADATIAALVEANYADAVLKAAEQAQDTADAATATAEAEATDG